MNTKTDLGNDANRALYPRADVKFVLFHKPTKTEIEMPVLSICEEYSTISFGTSENDYEGKYNGIGRLPSYPCDDYDVYVEIYGVRHLYDGVFYSNNKEVRRNTTISEAQQHN